MPKPSLTYSKNIYSKDTIIVVVSGASSYLWSSGTTNNYIYIAYNDKNIFYVKGWNELCFDSIVIRIDLSDFGDYCQFGIPNVFTPNGDNINDYFEPNSNCPLVINEFNIYNRWGEKIFSGNSKNKYRWDGSYKGIIQTIGVYVFYIRFTLNGVIKEAKGSVTVIR